MRCSAEFRGVHVLWALHAAKGGLGSHPWFQLRAGTGPAFASLGFPAQHRLHQWVSPSPPERRGVAVPAQLQQGSGMSVSLL